MLRPRWYKIIDDLWNNKGRTLLVVLAIAVGVMLFGGVFMGNTIMNEAMSSSYRATNPATITMIVSPFERDLISSVSSLREVSAAAGQTNYPVKLLLGDDSYNLNLIALDEYEDIEVNRVAPETGAWPPALRKVVLERTSVPIAGVEIGDTIRFELPNGDIRELEVSGTVHSLHVFPVLMSLQASGYVSADTLRWLGHSGSFNQLNVATLPDVNDIHVIDDVANTVRKRVENDGYVVGSVTTRLPDENLVADQISGVGTFLNGIGAFSLILSAFLVVNTIAAVLAQQRRQIGMLKAVGATGSQVIGLYLTLVISYGVLAFIVALPAGIIFSLTTIGGVMSFGNFDTPQFWVPPHIVFMMAAASVLLPLLAALIPVLGGTRVTVREAITDYGIKQRKGGLLDRILAAIRGLPRPMMLSLRNTFRRRLRLALTLSTLTLAGAIFIGVLSTRESLVTFLDQVLEVYGYDVQIVLNEPQPVRMLQREAFRVEGVTVAEGWANANAQVVRESGELSPSFGMTGIPPDSQLSHPAVLEGRWLRDDDEDVVIVAADFAHDEGVEVGDTITLRIGPDDHDFFVAGTIGAIGGLYVPFDTLAAIQGTPGEATEFVVGTVQHDIAYETVVLTELEENLKQLGIGVGPTVTQAELVENQLAAFDFIIGFMLTFAVFLGLVGGLGMTSTMSLNVLERTREIGVMRSIGAGNRSLRRVILIEGVFVALMSWVFAGLVSYPVSALLRTALGVSLFGAPSPPAFSYTGVLIWLPTVVVLSIVSSLLPARRAIRISIREALAYE